MKDKIVHDNIFCDVCRKNNIIGVRYKCLNCPIFDLCEQCEERGDHPQDHLLIKIRQPKSNQNLELLQAYYLQLNNQKEN